MTTARRWALVAAGVVVLILLPFAVGRLPAGRSDVGAAQLWRRILASDDRPYSGYAESQGSLALPVSDDYNSIADLLGGRTQQRVWWRGATDYRVDAVSAFGETDSIRDAWSLWSWRYEKQDVTRTMLDPGQQIRLPSGADLLPPELGRRLLADAKTGELTRQPGQRIAGVDAAGLRLTPSDPASSIAAVDVWADPDTGLPLRVAVTGRGERTAAVTAAFLSFSADRPSTAQTHFTPHTPVHVTDQLDLASAINRYAPIRPPSTLAGLSRSGSIDTLRAIGVYGRGVTELIAVPLRGRIAGPLREQLTSTTPLADDGSVAVSVGPLHLLLTQDLSDGRSWLVTGTVTAATLQKAAAQLVADPPQERQQ